MPKQTKPKTEKTESLKLPVRDDQRERFKVPDLDFWTLDFNAASITGLSESGFNFKRMQDADVSIIRPLIFYAFQRNHKFTVKTADDAIAIWSGYSFPESDGEDGGIFNKGIKRLIELFAQEASIVPNEGATVIQL